MGYFFLFFVIHIVSGEAVWSAGNSGKPLSDRGFTENPAGELTALSGSPSWWGGASCSLPRNPTPVLGCGLDF